MMIKQVKCEQFAGVMNKDLNFADGMNVIVGDNESGKSTMVDLIYQLMFRGVKLDKRKDADFINGYFPKTIANVAGDCVDGVLEFETDNGTYKLSKEWEEKEGKARLTLPDGTLITNMDKIREILDEELEYRQGVYNEIVFASQKRDQMAVESIMRALDKKNNVLEATQDDFASTLNKAVLETGGVSLDAVEKQLKDTLASYESHWDFDNNCPDGGAKRGINNKWKKDVGHILECYYELEEVRQEKINAAEVEHLVEEENAKLQVVVANKKEAEEKRNNFLKYRDVLGQMSLLSKMIEEQSATIAEQDDVVIKWPVLVKNKEQAKELDKDMQQAEVRELYCKAEVVQKQLEEKTAELSKLKIVDGDDVKNIKDYKTAKQLEESKLAGMNLIAKLKQLGDSAVDVTSAVTGETLDITDGEFAISEAVTITVPGIFEMQLMPQGVDVEQVQHTIKDLDEKINAIYQKYDVTEVIQLEELEQTYRSVNQEVEQLKMSLERILGDTTWDEVKVSYAQISDNVGTISDIQAKMDALCCGKSLVAYIAGLESTLETYARKYGTVEALQGKLTDLRKECETNKQKLSALDDVPEEYKGIQNPDEYDQILLDNIESYGKQMELHSDSLREAERKLGDKTSDEYLEELQEKEALFNQKKLEHKRWKHIYDVFCEKKQNTSGNPVLDIEAKFKEYLKDITAGSVKLTSMDDKMSVQIASDNHALSYNILSEGTKDTISLAFRLAMLEHLYPNGNGLAIFDDPFTDMDPTRVDIACKLLKKFASNNQVIFVTCDGKYQNLLGGNVIQVSK